MDLTALQIMFFLRGARSSFQLMPSKLTIFSNKINCSSKVISAQTMTVRYCWTKLLKVVSSIWKLAEILTILLLINLASSRKSQVSSIFMFWWNKKLCTPMKSTFLFQKGSKNFLKKIENKNRWEKKREKEKLKLKDSVYLKLNSKNKLKNNRKEKKPKKELKKHSRNIWENRKN